MVEECEIHSEYGLETRKGGAEDIDKKITSEEEEDNIEEGEDNEGDSEERVDNDTEGGKQTVMLNHLTKGIWTSYCPFWQYMGYIGGTVNNKCWGFIFIFIFLGVGYFFKSYQGLYLENG